MAEDFNAAATKLIGEKRLAEARTLLQEALAQKPEDWQPVQADGDDQRIYFWDRPEFLAFCA